MGRYGWSENIDRARVWRSAGIAENAGGSGRSVRYVPVRLTVIDASN
jgi:hypothetical protein